MHEKNCKKINRKLSRYLDNEVSTRERIAIETHIKACADCAAEKEELQKLTTIFRQIPNIMPAENFEGLFWDKVNQAKKQKIIERIRSFITQWDFMPVYYPATALLLIGLAVGMGFSKIYDSVSYQDRLKPSAVEYLALHRVGTIPYSSFAGVYLSGAHLKQDNKDDAK